MNRIRNKKGMLYTLSLTLLAFALLLLALLFFRHSQDVESRHVELSFSQKIYDLDTSVQGIFSEAFLNHANVNFEINSNGFIIRNSFPNNFSSFDSFISELESAVEEDFPVLDVDASSFISNHQITFFPSNLKYEQNSENSFRFLPNALVDGYSLNLTFFGEIGSCSISTNGGTFDFSFYASGSVGDCNLPSTTISDVTINMVIDGQDVTIALIDTGSLILTTNVSAESYLLIDLDSAAENLARIPISVEINDTSFDFYKIENSLVAFE